MSVANGLALPNTIANGQTSDAPTMMADLNYLLTALNRALLDGGGSAGVNAGSVQIHSVAAGTAVGDAVNLSQLNGKAALGANSDITSLLGLTTPLSVAQGGTGANTAGGARTNLGLSAVSTYPEATAADYRTNTAARAVSPNAAWAAAAEVALTDAATIAVDMSTFLNAAVTLGGNRTLGTPSNAKQGQTGWIRLVQDATGSRTLAFGANWKFSSGTAPTLTTTAGANDLLYYQVITPTFVYATLVKDVK